MSVRELVEQILEKVKKGAMTAEAAQEEIRRLVEEAGAESSRADADSPSERRIKSAAQRARATLA